MIYVLNECRLDLSGAALISFIEYRLRVLEETYLYEMIVSEYTSILAAGCRLSNPNSRVSFADLTKPETAKDKRTAAEIIRDTLERLNIKEG